LIANFKKYLTNLIPMDDDVFNLSLNYLKIKKLKKNEYFVKEGFICNEIGFVNEGLFRIFYLKDGIEINTCFCKENSITSSFESFVKQIPSVENIQALEDSEILTLSYVNLLKLYELNPKWQMLSRLMTERECLRLTDRLTSMSFETAKERYTNLIKTQPFIVKRVSIQYIASYLGISRETLSRIRSHIEL
jgi:CRP-like cAMP-binding protein